MLYLLVSVPENYAVADRYQEFVSDETKRKWRWRRLNDPEYDFWKSVIYGIYGARALPPSRPGSTLMDVTCYMLVLQHACICTHITSDRPTHGLHARLQAVLRVGAGWCAQPSR